MLWALLLYLVSPTVADANLGAALLVGSSAPECELPIWIQPHDCPDRIMAALRVVADRESPGNFADHYRGAGRHSDDGWAERRVHGRAQRRDRFAMAGWCPWARQVAGSSTVGNHGLMTAYHRHYLGAPGNCVPWWAFVSTSVSAVAAARKHVAECGRADSVYSPDLADGWCAALIPQMKARRRRMLRERRSAAT